MDNDRSKNLYNYFIYIKNFYIKNLKTLSIIYLFIFLVIDLKRLIPYRFKLLTLNSKYQSRFTK
jgi:hypothetical protein